MKHDQLARPHDGTINMLAAALAETVADALDQAGVALTVANTVALTCALNKALTHVGCERERAVRQDRLERRAAWVAEQGLLRAGETAERLGLTLREVETARRLAILAPVAIPAPLRATSDHFTPESWRYYRPDLTLTPTERTRIAHETLLTRAGCGPAGCPATDVRPPPSGARRARRRAAPRAERRTAQALSHRRC